MGFKYISLCTQIIVFAFVLEKSDGIQCFNCQAPIPESGEDPCRGAPLVTCPEPSTRCLSARFVVSAKPLKNEEEVISALTCFPDMKGRECDFFLENVQQNTPPQFKVRYHGECKVCSTDGCNSAPGTKLSLSLFAAAFVTSLVTLLQI